MFVWEKIFVVEDTNKNLSTQISILICVSLHHCID